VKPLWDVRAIEVLPGLWDVSAVLWEGPTMRSVTRQDSLEHGEAYQLVHQLMAAAEHPPPTQEVLDLWGDRAHTAS
jgi:hypothetical protein